MEENEVENQRHCISVAVELDLFCTIRAIIEDDECDLETKQTKKKQAIKEFIKKYASVYPQVSEEEIKEIARLKLTKMLDGLEKTLEEGR